MKQRLLDYAQRSLKLLLASLLLLPLVLYAQPYLQRPPQTETTQRLFQGITYDRKVWSLPPAMVHIVTIDLTAPGINIFVTPGMPTADDSDTNARTTSEFLTEFKLQLAVNANFFYDFEERNPWDFYPRTGDRVQAIGQAISNGFVYSEGIAEFAALCFAANHQASMVASGDCPLGTKQAISGNTLIVRDGKPSVRQDDPDSAQHYPRTVAAIDAAGEKLWLIAVDGKQPLYSEGATLAAIADLAIKLGAQTALNLDGGGSTTIVTATSSMATGSGTKLLNSPIHTKIPMRERPIANHLGFYANPL
jgi:hypothetical protein